METRASAAATTYRAAPTVIACAYERAAAFSSWRMPTAVRHSARHDPECAGARVVRWL
jgi:hypothetical protein